MDTNTTSTAPAADHAHRWVIETPNGPESRGVCKICRVEKGFKNWIAEADFITSEERKLAA
jgi:hypothetical protein